MSAVVTGEVVFDPPPADPGRAAVYVRVEDVSLADAAAVVVAADVVRDAAAVAAGRVPFRLAVPAVDPRASYTVRAHVDLDGDGVVGRGDLISKQSYPVLTYGYPAEVRVHVSAVG